MKILVIPSWYPNGEDKLMGIYHKEFCEALSKRDNIKVDMLYIDRQRLNAPFKYITMDKKEIIEENGYKVYIRRMLDIHKINESLQIKNYVKKLEQLYLEYLEHNSKPDLIHAHVIYPAGYAACKLGKKYNIPVIVTEHSSYYARYFLNENKIYGDYVLRNSTFTTVSNYMCESIKDKGYDCTVLPNLVDTDSFHIKRKKIKDLKLVTVSGLREGKRIDDIIAALKLIIEEENIKASLTIVGDGFLENYYKNKCQELGMDNYVNFVGRKSKKEIANILAEHNIYVIASSIETFCIPGIEALASGMPIVSTRCLGPEEYISPACGKLVDVGDIRGMKEAILDVYNNLDKYDIKTLRNVADKYSRKNVTDLAIKIYKEIVK